MKKKDFSSAMEVLQNREAFLDKLSSEAGYKASVIGAQLLLIFIFTFFYGIIMGSYNSLTQAISTGLKLWILFSLTLAICFPSFYIVQLILGSKIKILQLLIILLSGMVMVSVTMLAFAPIVLFFQLSGDNYYFLQLLHVFIFGFSGLFGMRVVLSALTTIFEKENIYPKIGLSVFKIWVIIFAFVGMQLSWNMRPFIGSKQMEFQIFRPETQGNFYGMVFGALGKMMGLDKGNNKKDIEPLPIEERQLDNEPSSKDSIENSEFAG